MKTPRELAHEMTPSCRSIDVHTPNCDANTDAVKDRDAEVRAAVWLEAAKVAGTVKVPCGYGCPSNSHFACPHDEQANATVEALRALASTPGAPESDWSSVERNAAEVMQWPAWKRLGSGLLTEDGRSAPPEYPSVSAAPPKGEPPKEKCLRPVMSTNGEYCRVCRQPWPCNGTGDAP